MFDIKDILALMCVDGIGPVTFLKSIQVFENPRNILSAPGHDLKKSGIFSDQSIDQIIHKKYESCRDIQLKWVEHSKAKLLHYWDSDYPTILKQIYDPPILLYYFGSFKKEDEFSLAVVGSRHPDKAGKDITETICRQISENKITIVSGMAKGIDSIAHYTAMKNDARTIAVLGTPLDTIYPAENKNMVKKIAEHGAVISEFLIGKKPVPANFVRRNRIISGLSRGVIITQAGDKSGALITGFNAIDQNREVFAVPGLVQNNKHKGCHRLIKHGAKLLESFEDILIEFPSLSERLRPQQDWIPQSVGELDLSDEELHIMEMLGSGEFHIDEILQNTGLDLPDIHTALLGLELRRYIKQNPGKMYKRIV